MDHALKTLKPKVFRVHGVRRETYDTFTLSLVHGNGDGPFIFKPGQFNMLYIFGVGEVPVSISGDTVKPDLLVHTARAVGAVTKAICGLKRGDVIGIRGPFGTNWPVDEAAGNDVVIVAGGIGLAPLRPAMYRLLAQREKYGRVVLLYGARTPKDLLYINELESWRGRFDVELNVTTDVAQSGWHGNVGVVTTLIPKAHFDPMAGIAMVCGPEIMMRFTVNELMKCGMVPENIYISLERNMKCGTGLCGHCQWGPLFICKDGPVFNYGRIKDLFAKREL